MVQSWIDESPTRSLFSVCTADGGSRIICTFRDGLIVFTGSGNTLAEAAQNAVEAHTI